MSRATMVYLSLSSFVAMVLCAGCVLWNLWLGGWEQVQFDAEEPTAVATRVVTDSTESDGVTLVKASINGVEGWFVLDTGASVAVLDDEPARAAGLSSVGSIGIGGCGIRADVQKGTFFQLGPFIAKDPLFVVVDLDVFLQDIDADIKIAGIIGYALFQHAVVTIDYNLAGDQVYIEDPATFEAPADHWHPMRIIDDGPVVEGAVAGAEPGLFYLDTGKSGTVSLSVPYTKRHSLLEGRTVEPASNRRICGISEELEGTVDWLTIAGNRIDQPTVRFRKPDTEGGDADRTSDAVVGREILKRFNVTFDYANKRIRLAPTTRNSSDG